MSINVKIEGFGKQNTVGVTKDNELITGPISSSTPTSVVIVNVANTAFNLQVPIANKRFRLTDIIISTDKNVNINGAIIEIYEALSIDTTTTNKEVLRLNFNRQDKLPIIGLNWEITTGRWLNIKSDETNVDVTIAGYYVDV